MSKVQSVVFEKRYWTPERAEKKLKTMGMVNNKVDETVHKLRFRQAPPHKDATFRTKQITPTMQFVIEIPKGKARKTKK